MASNLDLSHWELLPDATLLTVAEVAAILRMSKAYVYSAAEKGRMEVIRLRGEGRGRLRIEKRVVAEYLERSKLQPAQPRRESRHPRRVAAKPFKHIRVPTDG
jgi:excisionase family DNA binding protein